MGQLLWQERIDRWSRFDQFPSPPPASYCIASRSGPSSRHCRLPYSSRSSNTNESNSLFFFVRFCGHGVWSATLRIRQRESWRSSQKHAYASTMAGKKGQDVVLCMGREQPGAAVTKAGIRIFSTFKIIQEEGRQSRKHLKGKKLDGNGIIMARYI